MALLVDTQLRRISNSTDTEEKKKPKENPKGPIQMTPNNWYHLFKRARVAVNAGRPFEWKNEDDVVVRLVKSPGNKFSLELSLPKASLTIVLGRLAKIAPSPENQDLEGAQKQDGRKRPALAVYFSKQSQAGDALNAFYRKHQTTLNPLAKWVMYG